MQENDDTPAALIDLDDIAATLGASPGEALAYLGARFPAVAMYHDRPLWLPDQAHEAAVGYHAAQVRAAAEETGRPVPRWGE